MNKTEQIKNIENKFNVLVNNFFNVTDILETKIHIHNKVATITLTKRNSFTHLTYVMIDTFKNNGFDFLESRILDHGNIRLGFYIDVPIIKRVNK